MNSLTSVRVSGSAGLLIYCWAALVAASTAMLWRIVGQLSSKPLALPLVAV
jgi:hypothetical protein